MIVEVDGIWYISVKGTAEAYDNKHPDTIRNHIRKNRDIFNKNIINLKGDTTRKKFESYFSKGQVKSHGIWLNKFAFVEIGTLLNSSPKTIPIKVICFLNKE